MELLSSRLLLIAGLLMLSWHGAASLPTRNQPEAPTVATTHQKNLNTTPHFNTTEVILQSIFDINPSCQAGWILVGGRCRKMA